nr:hypothetical protein [Schaalia sp. Marseille-Q2122]
MRPRLVLVYRNSELTELLARHSTRGQAEFFLRSRGRSLDDVDKAHATTEAALGAIRAAVPTEWNVAEVERNDLSRFLFLPQDVIAVVGPDGLVANVAKYLKGQPVFGINPMPGVNAGVLVPLSVQAGAQLLGHYAAGRTPTTTPLTMVRCELDDGQELNALNDIFIGHTSHQSARYLLNADGRQERQSSSGIIASTGAGATGWAASLAPAYGNPSLPGQTDRAIAWFVREAWPSPTTGTSLICGTVTESDQLTLTVQSESLVAFGDGLEDDRLRAQWGQTLTVGVAKEHLHLVQPPRR